MKEERHKNYILYDFIYMKFKKRQNLVTVAWLWPQGLGRGVGQLRDGRELWEVMEQSCIVVVLVVR